MSIAYLDPGNVESDLQAGAAAEYKVRVCEFISHNPLHCISDSINLDTTGFSFFHSTCFPPF